MRLLEEERSLSEVARMVGSSVSSVWNWREALARDGDAGLRSKPASGRPSRLTAKQRAKLPKLLLRGARAHGYTTDLWTTSRVAEVISREFDVEYHPAHVSRILGSCGWTCQKPERRAMERDEKAIEHWKRYKWTAVKKKPSA